MRLLRDNLHDFIGKTVLVRCNFDVPIDPSVGGAADGGKVLDSTRIEGAGETLRLLLDQGCKIVLLAHYDRPEGRDKDKSLLPVVDVLEEMLGETVDFIEEIDKLAVENSPARIVLLENLRFWPGEKSNDKDFVANLSKLGEVYVNEAFANSHRMHASVSGLAEKMYSVAGVQLEREIKVLSKIRENPSRPLVVVIGGAKLETKEPLVWAFKDKADAILVGGKVADDLRTKHADLPKNVLLADQQDNLKDISEESARMFANRILSAGTVIWNGTLGVFEDERYRNGTILVANAVDQTKAFTVVGGGDTETALTVLDLEHNIDHISSGGGAMLEFLVHGTLVGIEALGYG